jgi:hypothetical protein
LIQRKKALCCDREDRNNRSPARHFRKLQQPLRFSHRWLRLLRGGLWDGGGGKDGNARVNLGRGDGRLCVVRLRPG